MAMVDVGRCPEALGGAIGRQGRRGQQLVALGVFGGVLAGSVGCIRVISAEHCHLAPVLHPAVHVAVTFLLNTSVIS